MTDKLEQEFFKTFGIEPEEEKYCYWECKKPELENVACNNTECEHYRHEIYYPTITDRHLLELFDILRTAYNIDFWSIDGNFVMDLRDKQASFTNIFYRTGGDLKTSILSSLNLVVKQNFIGNDTIKHQVQALFKEG